jgi:hypothetical protein
MLEPEEESLKSSVCSQPPSRRDKSTVKSAKSTGIGVARESAIVNTVCVWKLFVTERL